MPRLACWFVRAALVDLLAAFTAGALLLADKGAGGRGAVWALFATHVELALVGWVIQLALGVAFWVLPRLAGGTSRGPEGPAWAAFWLLNAGVLLAIAGSLAGGSRGGLVVLAGRGAELAAVGAFAIHAWPRVRAAASGG